MRKAFSGFLKATAVFLAVLFSILFVLTALISLLLFNLEARLFNPDFYTNALSEQPIISKLIPAEGLRTILDQTMDQMVAYLNGDADEVNLSLIPIKQKLVGQNGVNVVLDYMQNQASCTAEELNQLLSENVEADLIYCNPPAQSIPELQTKLLARLFFQVGKIPDQFVLFGDSSTIGQALSIDETAIRNFNLLRIIMRFSPLISLGMLLVVTLLVVRNIRGWLRWWGIPIFIVGVLGAVIALVIPLLLGWWLQNPLHISPQASLLIPDFLANVMRALGRSYSTGVLFQSLALGLLGLVSIIISMFLRTKPKVESVLPAEKPGLTPE